MNDQPYDGIAEQKKISPGLLAWVSIPLIAIIYQGMGGAGFVIIQNLFPDHQTTAIRMVQTLAQYIFLLVPAIFLVLLHTRDVLSFTFLKRMPPVSGWVLSPLLIIFTQPIVQYLALQERKIPWPPEMIAFRDQMEQMIETLVGADSIPEFMFVAFMVAVTPAICEEFYFRGYLLRNFSRQYTGTSAFLLSGVLFGLFHFNPFQMSGLIILGVVFSFLVWQYQSLWVGVVAHFVHNFIAAFGLFMSKRIDMGIDLNDPEMEVPFSVFLMSLFICSLIVLAIIKQKPALPAEASS